MLWRLTVIAYGGSPERQTPIAPWTGSQLAFWLTVPTSLGIPGQVAFQCTLTGKRRAHTSRYAALVALVKTANIRGGSPFRLQNWFAARQLRRFDTATVAK